MKQIPPAHPSPRSSYALGVLFVCALFCYIDRSLLSILQVPIKQDLGLSDVQLGALTGLSFAIFYSLCALPMATLADRIDRRWLLAVYLAVWSLMTALCGVAGGFVALLVFRIGVAIGEAGSVPTTHSLISDLFPLERRAGAIAVWALAYPIGTMLGVLLGGWLTDALDWRTVFFVIGGVGICLAPMILTFKEPVRGNFDSGILETGAPIRFRQAASILWSLRSFRWLLLAATLQVYVHASLVNWMVPLFSRSYTLTLSQIGTSVGLLMGLGGGIGAFFGGVLADRLSRRDRRWYSWLPAAASLLLTPIGLAYLFAPSVALGMVSAFFVLVLVNIFTAPLAAVTQSMVSSGMRGFTSAVVLTVPTVIGLGLGPLVTGWASDYISSQGVPEADALRYALASALLSAFLAGFAFLGSARYLEQDLSSGGMPSPTQPRVPVAAE